MNPHDMCYSTVLATFKTSHEACISVKDEVDPKVPKVPKINDRDNCHKIIRWSQIFKDCLTSSCASRGPLSYATLKGPVVLDEIMDHLLASY